MTKTSQGEQAEDARIVLGLLESVERNGSQSQRRLASDLGIALGLVNAYLRRCVKKGLVKVSEAPARRYIYFLTPLGFAEKSRLTASYLSYSFSFFRQAQVQCAALFDLALTRKQEKFLLVGDGDLAEIAALVAGRYPVKILGTVPSKDLRTVRGHEALGDASAAAMITETAAPQEVYAAVVAVFGADRTYAPDLLRISTASVAAPDNRRAQ